MSKFSGAHSAFSQDFNSRLIPLTARLKKVEDKIYKLIIKAVGNAKMSTAYWNKIKIELNLLYAEMNNVFGTWAAKEIPARYTRSLKLIQKRINASAFILNTASRSMTELLTSNIGVQITRGLIDSSVQSYLSASVVGKQNLRNLFITTQQALINESMVNVAVATGFQMGDLREAKTLLKALFETPAWEAVEKRQFVQAGKLKFRPHYYAELVARTKFHQAHSQGALAQGLNYNTDLMEISSHNTSTAICMPYEGKIFSVSGKDPRFPPLVDSPPYHPNCLHLMFPTFESALQTQGTLERFSEFSLDKITRPPIPASFIPVGAR